MKKMILPLCFAIAIVLLPASAAQGNAQDVALKAKINFSFNVCREQLPAGTYTVKHPAGNSRLLVIQSEDNRSIDIACVNDMQSPNRPAQGQLIFTRYGDQYFLAEAWWPGDTMGHSLVKSEKEQALIKEYGITPSKKPEKVTIKLAKPKK